MSEQAFMRAIFERNNNILGIAVVISVVLNAVLFFSFLGASNKRPIAVYVNEQNIPVFLTTRDYAVTEDILASFVRMVMSNYLSFGPGTLPKQLEIMKVFLEKAPQEAMLKTYEQNKDKLIEGEVFQQFTIDTMEIAKKSAPYIVKVDGVKTVLANQRSKYYKGVYFVTVNKVNPTKENPFGLIIACIREQEKK